MTDHERAKGTWNEADTYWATWVAEMDSIRGRVRSMSGRTREHLGAPTSGWLLGE